MTFCISFGKIDKFIVFPLIGSIFKFLFQFIFRKSKVPNDTEDENINKNPIILCISTSFGMSLSLFLYIIYYESNNYSKKRENVVNLNSPLNIELEYNNQYKIITYNKFKYILISTILNFVYYFIFYSYFFEMIINYWFLDALLIFAFSHFIFKIKLYRHQYLCMIIFTVVGAFLNILIAFYKDNNLYEVHNLLPHIFKIFGEIILSLEMVINKYTIEKNLVHHMKFVFIKELLA